VHSVHNGQASFTSTATPMNDNKKSILGEMILKHYAPSLKNIGLHFQQYDSFILPPIIMKLYNTTAKSKPHYCLPPSFDQDCLEMAFRKLPHLQFHWFLHGIKKPSNQKHHPISSTTKHSLKKPN
jgi:hypothetical protein